MFAVLPLVQVRSGAVVGPGSSPGGARDDNAALAREAGEAVLVDLDGLASNRPDLELVRDVARRNDVWIDAGSREANDVVELFVAGASRVTVRWAHLRGASELEEVADIAEPGVLYLGLEFKDRFVPNARMPGLGVDDALQYARKLELPVVAIDVMSRGDARRAVGPSFQGERWYAAPLPRADLAPLESEGWTGAMGPPLEGGAT